MHDTKVSYDFKKIREKYFPGSGGQQEMADLLGVKHQQVSAWERGTRNPSNKSIKKIAAALNVSLDDLRSDVIPEDRENAAYWKGIAEERGRRIIALEEEVARLRGAIKHDNTGGSKKDDR